MTSVSSGASGEEPPMYLQRPSSARSQDVSHVLARTFRQLFTRDVVPPDTVEYLTTSKGGDDEYHEKYVDALSKIQEERDRRMTEAAMLERHIMQAQARAMSADERALNRSAASLRGFPDLGLPPARSHFPACIDSDLLRQHNLITPEDFATEKQPVVPLPSGPPQPCYARDTKSSTRKLHSAGTSHGMQTPLLSTVDPMESFADTSVHAPLSARLSPKKGCWKNTMDAETREINRKDLENLQARVDFLKNPRFVPPTDSSKLLTKGKKKKAKEIGIKPKPDTPSTKEPAVIFLASPAVVKFEEYKVGQVYEIALELKNVTSVLRPVRVVPPATQYFSVGLGQFPGEHGLVAPGMSCRYTVQFSPDSLSDFDDVLTIHTQASEPMMIQLQGRRPPPILTMPPVLDIGQCLVGGMKVAQFSVRNEGGGGRFCVVAEDNWPSTNFKSCMSLGTVPIPPFEVRPPVFQVEEGEVATMEVLFAPNDVEVYEANIVLVCDNCHVKHITIRGEGQVASVQLAGVEDGVSETYPEELSDISAQHLIRFDKLNPYTYTQKTYAVRNQTKVDMVYSWVVVKPYIQPRDLENSTVAETPSERVQDLDSAFSVEPDKGILCASMTSQFTVTFAPPDVQSYHSVLHLVLHNIPRPREPSDALSSSSGENQLRPTSMLPMPEPQVEDVTAMEIEVRGKCEPLKVSLHPFAISIPGHIMVETAVKKRLKIANCSPSAVTFQWEKLSTPYILEMEPSIGEVPGHGELDVDLTINSQYPGVINQTLLCHVQHIEKPLTLNIQASVMGPDVIIEEDKLDFGLVRLGEQSRVRMNVQNKSRVTAKWTIQEAETHVDGSDEFTFSPSCGELRPLETVQVSVLFIPKSCRSMKTVFELTVVDGHESVIAAQGEVQSPVVCLLTSAVCLENVFLDVPIQHTVTMLNQTLLQTNFQWGQLVGFDSKMCSVSVEPFDGVIGPREELAITINFTAHTTGELNDLRIPCTVGGMEKSLVLALSADVKGLSVTYVTQNMKEDMGCTEQRVDFGPDIKRGDMCRQYVYIKNNSAISAPFSLHMEHFSAKPPTPPTQRPNSHMPNKSDGTTAPLLMDRGQRRSTILTKTPNVADPLSKTPTKASADLCRSMLREGLGAAFAVSPASGVLQPFSEQVVEMTGFTDMWGQYTDALVCKVEKLPLHRVPVCLCVSGCPLTFQMVAAQPQQTPIVRFGTHAAGVAPTVRQMRVNNTSPFDIRLDWQTFSEDNSKKQLLDFVVSYGEEFPLRDANGDEIVPEEEDEEEESPRSVRSVTSALPDSMDSSPSPRPVSSGSDKQAGEEEEEEEKEKEEEVKETRPKLISVTTRLHGGKISEKPYRINPSQVVIPARSNSCINVSFTPHPTEEVARQMDCRGYALGYMSLSDRAREVSGQVVRPTGYAIQPLRLEMTAQIKPALLSIECNDGDDSDSALSLRYHATTSDLMTGGSGGVDRELAADCVKLHTATLSNHTQTPLDFRLLTAEPFYLVEVNNGRPTSQLLQTDWCRLQPRQNVMVSVGFRVSLDLLQFMDLLEDNPNVELETLEKEKKLHFRNNLIVEFNNKSVQRLALHATLVIPSLQLSRNVLDFSTCLVGQRREMQIILSNPTASHSCFTIMQESQSETCAENTFVISPNNGFLEAQINNLANNKCLLHVYFTAKHSEEYESTFVVQGMLGEEPQHLTIRGSGSYDGKHEALLDV